MIHNNYTIKMTKVIKLKKIYRENIYIFFIKNTTIKLKDFITLREIFL